MEIKYPSVAVQLTGTNGNAFALIGTVSVALRSHGVDEDEIEAFTSEAMAGDYNQLLQVCMEWVDVL